ncbi:SixA phosphatase family protein [Streptomyces sp. NPDC057743]|uniref:SixA phosphatase family protein n=1 Tax=Streptomyces sp. NPDC057743 TaxID=3346236 RepID=UPI0036916DBB
MSVPGSAHTRLIVLRHAKSAWPEGVPDHERPLAGRGRRDAPAAGRWLRQRHCAPDVVLCSTSRRTRETWERIAAELGPSEPEQAPEQAPETPQTPPALRPSTASQAPCPSPAAHPAPEVVFEPRVYQASGAALLEVVRAVPERWRTALLIGHLPGVQDLVLSLTGGGDDEALARAREKFPTSALAVLTLPGGWADLAPGRAELTDFVVPRGPKGGA